MNAFKTLLLAGAVLALAAPATFAQPGCLIGDDGFIVGCCLNPVPNLPQLPSLSMTASYACFNNCQAGNPLTPQVVLGVPQYFLCDYALIPITVTFPGGITFVGPLLAKYSRTWLEPNATGLARQVWRFLVNGDLNVISPGPIGVNCPVPACATPPINRPVHWDGHLDYACDPTSTVGYLAAISLTHMPGCLAHAPFAAYPVAGAAAHPNWSYHLVGPAPFAFANVAEPQGPLVAEDLRSSFLNWSPFVYQCRGEAQLQQGGLQTQFTNCLCSPILPVIGPWKHQNIGGTVCCQGSIWPFNSIPLAGTPLPTGFAALSLGNWLGAPGAFPGNRSLHFYVGVIQYVDPCNPAAPVLPVHVVTGVGTAQHPGHLFPSPSISTCAPPPPPMVSTFIDLQNMLILVNLPPGQPPLPGIGGLFASTLVFNLNTP